MYTFFIKKGVKMYTSLLFFLKMNKNVYIDTERHTERHSERHSERHTERQRKESEK